MEREERHPLTPRKHHAPQMSQGRSPINLRIRHTMNSTRIEAFSRSTRLKGDRGWSGTFLVVHHPRMLEGERAGEWYCGKIPNPGQIGPLVEAEGAINWNMRELITKYIQGNLFKPLGLGLAHKAHDLLVNWSVRSKAAHAPMMPSYPCHLQIVDRAEYLA